MIPCGLDYFKGFQREKIEQYKLHNLLCIKNRNNFTLKGDFYSEKFRYLEVRMFRCENSTLSKISCKNVNEIDEFFKETTFSIPIINSYFDYGDFQKVQLGKNDERMKKGIELDKAGVIR